MTGDKSRGYCGYDVEKAPFEVEEESLPWKHWNRVEADRYECTRSVWKDGHCVWHADTEKSAEDLRQEREDDPERLDGAIFRNITLEDEDLFVGCSLQQAEFENVTLNRSQFTNARLWDTTARGRLECSKTDFDGADLRDLNAKNSNWLDFSEATFVGADLTDADFTGCCPNNDNEADTDDESYCTFAGADFENATLDLTNFCCCDLSRANLTKVSAEGADFDGANLEEADLTQIDIRNADLIKVRLFWSFMSDVRVDDRTRFGQKCIYEIHPEESVIDRDIEGYRAAEWMYQKLQIVFQNNGLTDQAREYHVRKREAKRKLAWRTNDRVEWLLAWTDRLFSRHGDRPRRVIGWWVGVIVTSALLYSMTGFTDDTVLYRLSLDGTWDLYGGGVVIVQSLLFSIAVFSTLGAGDLTPVSVWTRALASVESLLGSFFIALFIFTLGRRIDW